MAAVSGFSDEPTRVTQLVADFLAGQSGSVVEVMGGPKATLSAGADLRDDCAVYDVDGPVTLVVGSDYIRGSKFILYELGLLSDFDIGYFLVAANVSDIAAMGATPLGVLTVVRYPETMDDSAFRSVLAGIHEACTDFGTMNVGGDIGAAERLILSGSAFGACAPGRALTRSGARPGDVLCVTGPTGILGAAVAYFPKQEEMGWRLPADVESRLLDSWRRPIARVAEGITLSASGFATACQDTSDGLKATVEQIAAASGVGFTIDLSAVSIDPAVAAVAGLMGVDEHALALSASADFQLAFTLPAARVRECREAFVSKGLWFDVIGTATNELDIHAVAGGRTIPLPGVAWKHQRMDVSTLVSHGTRDDGSRPTC
jgi:thiamine-monophosphate kinase